MFTLLDVDNKGSVGSSFIGRTAEFSFYGYGFFFGALQSSKVKRLDRRGPHLVVITKNSTYTFKKAPNE